MTRTTRLPGVVSHAAMAAEAAGAAAASAAASVPLQASAGSAFHAVSHTATTQHAPNAAMQPSADEIKMIALAKQADAALRRVQFTKEKVEQYLMSLDMSSLSMYERPRIQALIDEATVLCSVGMEARRHTRHDLARLVRSCAHRSQSLLQLFVEAKSVLAEGRQRRSAGTDMHVNDIG